MNSLVGRLPISVLLLMVVLVPIALSSAGAEPSQTAVSPLSTITETTTTTAGLLSSTNTVPPVAVGNSCSWYIDPFSALAGGFGGTIQASYPVRIVISSMTAFYSWANPTGNGVYHSGDCVGPSNSIVAMSYVGSYTFQANLSASGQYVVLLINESQNYVHVQVILYSSVTSTFTTTSG